MTPATQTVMLAGAAGPLQVAVDLPSVTPRGVMLVAHPHPLFSGSMDNKVVTTLARAGVAAGLAAVRMNFRGVGASGGTYDEGRGETDDLGQLLTWASGLYPGPIVLAGFSFGAFVAANLHARLPETQSVAQLILVGTAVSRFAVPDVPESTLVIHGEQDDTVPLTAVLDWARPQSLPVIVIPGANHFFDRKLPPLKRVVGQALERVLAVG